MGLISATTSSRAPAPTSSRRLQAHRGRRLQLETVHASGAGDRRAAQCSCRVVGCATAGRHGYTVAHLGPRCFPGGGAILCNCNRSTGAGVALNGDGAVVPDAGHPNRPCSAGRAKARLPSSLPLLGWLCVIAIGAALLFWSSAW